jgi:hypothetical protein
MADFDPYSALLADEPTALEMAKARAAALRGQNYAGIVMGLAHDPQAAKMGNELMQQAQTGQTQLGHLPGERIRQILGRQDIAKGEQEAAGLASPEYGNAGRLLLQRFGVPMPETTPNTAVRAVLPLAEKAWAAQQAAEAKKAALQAPAWYIDPNTGAPYNRHGPQPNLPGAGANTTTPGSPQPLSGKMLDKALKELGADFDPSGGRSGEFGKNQARVNAANRLLTLATDEAGNPKDLNPQQMPELAQALASLISGGGAGAQSQIEHLTPKTLRGDMQRTLQWLTGNPRGADQVAFVQNMIETAKRERETAGQAIESVRSQRGAKHQRVLMGNPTEAGRVLQGFGWDIGPDGMPVMKQAAPAAKKARKVYDPATGTIKDAP